MLPTISVNDTIRRLEQSLRDLEWAVSLVPQPLHQRAPFGMWSVAMNLAHLAAYEERLAAPSIEALAAGEDACALAPSGGEDWFQREAETLSRESSERILERLKIARQRQVETLRSFPEEAFNAAVPTLWGLRSPAWVLSKTFQHTWEHGNTILQIVLFAQRMA